MLHVAGAVRCEEPGRDARNGSGSVKPRTKQGAISGTRAWFFGGAVREKVFYLPLIERSAAKAERKFVNCWSVRPVFAADLENRPPHLPEDTRSRHGPCPHNMGEREPRLRVTPRSSVIELLNEPNSCIRHDHFQEYCEHRRLRCWFKNFSE